MAEKSELQNHSDKIWNTSFVSVFIANALMYLGQWMCNSLFAKYTSFLGAPVTVVGAATSAFASVSYTHLDVYKRQPWEVLPQVCANPGA